VGGNAGAAIIGLRVVIVPAALVSLSTVNEVPGFANCSLEN